MKKFLSERTLVVILFFTALVVFSFAQADARKVEAQLLQAGAKVVPQNPPAMAAPMHAATAARD